jgi:high-affinity nickel-transport protein
MNLSVLRGIIAVARDVRQGRFDEDELEARLNERGLMTRFFGRALRMVRRSEHIYPVGILFGLGFDTATEVGLLALTAGAASGRVPAPAVLALPILFAAGMSLMDTADGVFMCKAYRWAFSTPARKVYYNLAVTGLSVVVAVLIGSVELLQVASDKLGLTGGFWGWLQTIDFGTLGYVLVALFALTWLVALAIWRWGRIEERWSTPALANEGPKP